MKKLLISETQEKELINILNESELDLSGDELLQQAYSLPPDRREGAYDTLLQITKEMQAEIQDLKNQVNTIKQKRGLNEDSEIQKAQMPIDKKMNKPYCVDPEKVLIVKKHLDKRFKPCKYTKLEGGRPKTIKIACMMDDDGNPLKYMYKEEVQDYLIDEFQKMFLDKMEREMFLGKVLDAWFNNKIGVHGTLDVNHL